MKNFDVIGNSQLSGIQFCSNPHPNAPENFDNETALVEGVNKYPAIDSCFLFIHDEKLSFLIIDKFEAQVKVFCIPVSNPSKYTHLIGFSRLDDENRKFSVYYNENLHSVSMDEEAYCINIRFERKTQI